MSKKKSDHAILVLTILYLLASVQSSAALEPLLPRSKAVNQINAALSGVKLPPPLTSPALPSPCHLPLPSPATIQYKIVYGKLSYQKGVLRVLDLVQQHLSNIQFSHLSAVNLNIII